MPRLTLASALTRWLDAQPAAAGHSAAEISLELPGCGSVRALLEAAFVQHPRLRGYVLDERGAVRNHVVLFVDGKALADKTSQSQPLHADAQVYVMQALSGG